MTAALWPDDEALRRRRAFDVAKRARRLRNEAPCLSPSTLAFAEALEIKSCNAPIADLRSNPRAA